MATRIFFLLITLLAFLPVKAQNSGKREQLEKEIAELEAKLASLEESSASSGVQNSICYEKTLYTELPPMNDSQFLDFCSKELSKLKDIPASIDDRVISSCQQEEGIVKASFCVFSNPRAKPIDDEQVQLSKEKKLDKIRNTKKMYQNLIEALNKEVAANNIEIIDNAGNLAMKHLNLKEVEAFRPIIEDGKDKGVEKLKKKYGLQGRDPIKNEIAEVIDEGIAFAEEVASVIPGGDKLTCHYLWRIFKSVPEAGKMLGNGAATINIMFQRREYEKKLKELEQQEQELLNN